MRKDNNLLQIGEDRKGGKCQKEGSEKRIKNGKFKKAGSKWESTSRPTVGKPTLLPNLDLSKEISQFQAHALTNYRLRRFQWLEGDRTHLFDNFKNRNQ